MDLTNRSHRWVAAVTVVVCLVAPLLVACGDRGNTERPKETPQMQQMRKIKQGG
jgi:hypothetical protein